jgi:glycosyltransferase involved in cell wall biosynthesis
VGIDASNVRTGGGVTHLRELLAHTRPAEHGVQRVTVWGGRGTLAELPQASDWLAPVHEPALDGALSRRLWWQRLRLARLARAAQCDILFVPGGSYRGSFRPYVTMFRNMLPFDAPEMRRYAYGYIYWRLRALRREQTAAFRKADGVIFLNRHAQETIERLTGPSDAYTIIPHGVGEAFRAPAREQEAIEAYSAARPFRLVYTSIIDLYKHQWNVAEAVLRLRREGLPLALDLVGPAYPPALAKVNEVLARYHDVRGAVRIAGSAPNTDLPAIYRGADAFVFASTCENMPNALIEAMASALPIASSRSQPMPEILGDGGVYFDAEDVSSIADALRTLATDAALRARLAAAARARASAYSWDRCAGETFAFLQHIA